MKITVRETKLLELRINEDETMMLGNKKIDEVDPFTYLGSISSKDGECNEEVIIRIAKMQDAGGF